MKSLLKSTRFISLKTQRPFLSKFRQFNNQSAQSAEALRKKRNDEFHQTSTNYMFSPKEKLEELKQIDTSKLPHYKPITTSDTVMFKTVKFLRWASDIYFKDRLVHRAVMLETIAAVPGMIAGIHHHLRTLRRLEHDNWIKVLLDEAENERMHLMAFMEISRPSMLDRLIILAIQGIFWNIYLLFYITTPRSAHRFVGYLEEEAVKTYTKLLDQIKSGKVENCEVPQIAIDYWGLPLDAKLDDLVAVVRADEMDHRDVNHACSNYFRDYKHYTGYASLNITHDNIYSTDQLLKDVREHK